MNMKLWVLAGVFFLASCGGTSQQQAVSYNNNLVMIQQSLATKVQQAEQQIGTYTTSNDSTKAFEALKSAVDALSSEKKKVEELKFPGDDFGMKKDLLGAIDFLHKAYAEEYPKWLTAQFAATADAATVQRVQEEATAFQKKGAALDQQFLESQKKFAKEHKILLR